MTGRAALEMLIWMSEQAFDGDPNQSLLSSVRDLREAEWTAHPAGGQRSVSDILEHTSWAKWMYTDYAFGEGKLRGDAPPMIPEKGMRARPHEELMGWLREGHSRWMQAITGLGDDGELERERMTNWGERLPTRTLIGILIAHDFYHGGEINHIVAVLRGTDRWPYDVD
jgi:uncharacterized damage-inducible protein DinB